MTTLPFDDVVKGTTVPPPPSYHFGAPQQQGPRSFHHNAQDGYRRGGEGGGGRRGRAILGSTPTPLQVSVNRFQVCPTQLRVYVCAPFREPSTDLTITCARVMMSKAERLKFRQSLEDAASGRGLLPQPPTTEIPCDAPSEEAATAAASASTPPPSCPPDGAPLTDSVEVPSSTTIKQETSQEQFRVLDEALRPHLILAAWPDTTLGEVAHRLVASDDGVAALVRSYKLSRPSNALDEGSAAVPRSTTENFKLPKTLTISFAAGFYGSTSGGDFLTYTKAKFLGKVAFTRPESVASVSESSPASDAEESSVLEGSEALLVPRRDVENFRTPLASLSVKPGCPIFAAICSIHW